MKIVRIIARLNVGGPARHVVWLTEAARAAGHESLLVCGTVPPGEDDMGYFAALHGVEPVRVPEMSREISPKDVVTVWKLLRILRRERPDIVHTHTAKAGAVGRAAGLLYRWLTPSALWGRPRPCRFVHTYHGHVFHSYYGPRKTKMFLLVERLLARMTDCVVVISPQQLREINGRFGVGRAGQFRIVPLGLDAAVFADWRARRRQARASLGLGEGEDDTLLVGIVGRLTEIKNHRLFLEAAALLKRRLGAGEVGAAGYAGREGGDRADGTSGGTSVGPAGASRVRFVVVGDGHLRTRLEIHAEYLGLAGDVIFAGTRDDPENFYAALDIVALTSLNEGTPLTIIEAMANERPVVSTAVGGVVDLLGGVEPAELRRRHAWQVCERGVQVEPGDAEAFSRALEHLAERPGLREQMGARGREFVERHYSKERLAADVLRLYEGLVGAGRRERGAAGRDIPRAAARLKGD
jgi:glycosyltransferase involved in cell wall biosynthesis